MTEDEQIFEPFQTEDVDYGPSWGCIIGLGFAGIVLCILILVLAHG